MFDAMGEPGEDERWEIFYEFHEYLQKQYPLVCVGSGLGFFAY